MEQIAYQIYEEMLVRNVLPNAYVYGSLLMVCREFGDWNQEEKIMEEMEQDGISLNPVLLTSLMVIARKCDREDKVEMLWQLGEDKSIKPDENMIQYQPQLNALDNIHRRQSKLEDTQQQQSKTSHVYKQSGIDYVQQQCSDMIKSLQIPIQIKVTEPKLLLYTSLCTLVVLGRHHTSNNDDKVIYLDVSSHPNNASVRQLLFSYCRNMQTSYHYDWQKCQLTVAMKS